MRDKDLLTTRELGAAAVFYGDMFPIAPQQVDPVTGEWRAVRILLWPV